MCLHAPVVTYSRRLRDLLRRRWWVRCWECDYREGPFRKEEDAQAHRRGLDSAAIPVP